MLNHHLEVTVVYPGAVVAHLGPVVAYPGAIVAYPGEVMAHPGAVILGKKFVKRNFVSVSVLSRKRLYKTVLTLRRESLV